MPSCSVKWCGKDSGRFSKKKDNISFHRFPQNRIIKAKWIAATKRENWSPSSTSVICSRHFTKDCFFPTKLHRRLIDGSIPTLHLPILNSEPETAPLPTPLLAPSQSVSTNKIVRTAQVPPTEDYSVTRKRFENHINELTCRLADKQNKIKKLQNHTRYLKKKVELLKHIIRQSVENSEEALNSKDIAVRVRKKMIEATKKAIKQDKRIDEMLILKDKSPETKAMDIDLKLQKPKITMNGKSGFTAEVLDDLKGLANESGNELICTLIMDEIKINNKVEYDPGAKRTYGYVNIETDEATDSFEESTEALVFLIVPINYNLQVPIGYFFANGISCEQKVLLVQEALDVCYKNNITVKVLTFIGSARNVAMATTLGCSFKSTELKCSFKHPRTSEEVYIVLDVIHLMNMVRNAFEYYKIITDGEGNVVDWTLIENLKQLSLDEIKYLEMKTHKNNFRDALVKIKFYSQEITKNMADALLFCEKGLKHKQNCNSKSTARVLTTLHNLFEMLDSRASGRGFRQALDDVNHLLIFKELRECKLLLMSVKTERCDDSGSAEIRLIDSHRRIGFIGLCINIESYRNIYYDIERNRNCYVPYLSFQKFNHDPIKGFFCTFQRYCNGSPTARLFESFYREFILRNRLRSNSRDYCISVGNYINSYSSPLDRINLRFQRSQNDSTIYKCDTLVSTFERCRFLGFSNQSLARNVAQILVKKIQCPNCVLALISFERGKCSMRHLNYFNYKGFNVYPSNSIIKLCRLSEMTLKMFGIEFQTCNIKRLINKVLDNVIGESIFSATTLDHDNEHLIDLLRCVTEQYLLMRRSLERNK